MISSPRFPVFFPQRQQIMGNGAVAAWAFRRCRRWLRYRLCMRGSSHPALTGSVCAVPRIPLYHNGSKSRKTVPLRQRRFVGVISTGSVCVVPRIPLYRNGSKSGKTVPLRQRRFVGGFATGSVCVFPRIPLYRNGSKSGEMVPLRHGRFGGVGGGFATGSVCAVPRIPLYHNGSKSRKTVHGAVAAEAFRRCPLYRLCMRGSSHPALPQRQQIGGNGAIAAEAD